MNKKVHSIRPVYLLLLLIPAMLLFMSACSRPIIKTPPKRILIFHSSRSSEPLYPSFNQCLAEKLEKKGIHAELKFLYLDCDTYIATEKLDRTRKFLDSIQTWQPDLILVNQDEATYNLLAVEHPLVRQVPVIFSGVHFPNWELLRRYTNVTGFIDRPDYNANIHLIERILGKVRILINYDESFRGRKTYDLFMDQVGNKEFILNYNRLSKLYPEKFASHFNEKFLGQKLDQNMQRPDSIILDFIPFRRINGIEVFGELNGLEKHFTYLNLKHDFMSRPLGKYFEVPTFTAVVEELTFNHAYTGGYFSTYQIQTEELAHTAARILHKGVAPSDIPFSLSKKEYMFNWDDLQRFEIDTELLPAGSQIVNMPYYVKHKTLFLTLGIMLALIILGIISYLLFLYFRETSRKQQALLRLGQERQSLALAIEGGNTFVWKYLSDRIYFDDDFFSSLDMDTRIYTPEEFAETVHPEDRKKVLEKITHFRNHTVRRRSLQFRCNFNGEGYQWWEFRYGQINTGPDVSDFQINGLCLNIQKTKDNEAALIAARKKAEESDRMKTAFLANMSHEIRTPLNAIVGFSNLITSGEMDFTTEEKNEFLNLINTNCDLLLKLINDILDLSRIESGRMDFLFDTCNLTELMTSIYHTHQLSMPPEVVLELEVPQTPVYSRTDRHRLTQVVTNFINNAVKFTKKGYIRIGYFRTFDGKYIQLYVEDTGIGIPKEKQKAVFDRFNKLDEFAQGTGLGLAICKVIALRLKGNITLWSEEGKGSRFTLIVPFEKPDTLARTNTNSTHH